MYKIMLVACFLYASMVYAVEEGQIIDPTVPSETIEKKETTPVVPTPDTKTNDSYIECENDPKEFFTLYPENDHIGKVRLSSGTEPVMKGFFSYVFTYDFSKAKKGAVYLSLNRDITQFQEMTIPLYGDGSKNEVRIRFVDKDGEVYTTVLGTIVLDWKDSWKLIKLSPKDFEFTDWAETNTVNKKMDYPIVIQKIYLVYMNGGVEKGAVFLDDITIR